MRKDQKIQWTILHHHNIPRIYTKPQGSNPTCYSPEVFRPEGGEAVMPTDLPDSNANGRAATIIYDTQFQVLPSFVSLNVNEVSEIAAPD